MEAETKMPNARRFAAALFALLMFLGSAQAQQKRVALVIGNSAYQAVPRLANPANDGRLLAQTLAALGFQLVGGGAQLNLSKPAFDTALRDFGQALPGAEVALFYYAGHGMQVHGTNWLVPLDADPSRVQDLGSQMVDAAQVLTYMVRGKAKLNVLVLDACRNNPFIGSTPRGGETGLTQITPMERGGGPILRGAAPGLAQMLAPEGTVIAFATQPGNTAMDGGGLNSPYTMALVDAMRQRGLNVLSMFNRVGVAVKRATGGGQQPWVAISPIEGEYFFAGPGSGTVETFVPVAAAVPIQPAIGLRERIVAIAAESNIAIPPSLRIVAPSADVAPEIARFVGAWGPGPWLGEMNSKVMLIIDRVDASGNAHLIRLSPGECDNVECSKRSPKVVVTTGKIETGILSFAEKPDWRYLFEIGLAGWLHGSNHLVNYQAHSSGPLTRVQ